LKARDLLLVMMGLALGIAVMYGLRRPEIAEPFVRVDSRVTAAGPASVTVDEVTSPAPSGPEAAVHGFLAAELKGDFEASFHFLSPQDRRAFRGPAAWVAEHADLLPPLTGFNIESITELDDRAEVTTLLEFEAGLDEVVGLIPGRARFTWAVASLDDAWWIVWFESSLLPIYPPDAEAVRAVRSWAEARQACRPAREYEGGLFGTPGLAEQLCGARGTVQLGEPGRLENAVDAAPFVAAFGPEFGQWGRVVPIMGPVQLRSVVAPVGEEWMVIGVLTGERP
jgi:hypothetical protein